jgi:hypothetical protein
VHAKFSTALFVALLVAGLVLGACAGSSTTTTKTAAETQYTNFVVVGVAGDYDARAHLERRVVSNLRSAGASASAYHAVIGGNKPVTKDDVLEVVAQHGFDAVLAIRRIDGDVAMQIQRSRTETDATPIGGRVVNLFRSDYSDYTTPESVNVVTQATLAIELYDARSEEIVFSFDYETGQGTDIGLLIDETAAAVVKRIEREKLIAN